MINESSFTVALLLQQQLQLQPQPLQYTDIINYNRNTFLYKNILFTPKKTEHDVKKVKIVKVFKRFGQ